MNFFRDIIQDATGGASTARFIAVVANLCACLVWALVAITVAIVKLCKGAEVTLIEFPVFIGYCATLMGLKVFQRVLGEKDEPAPAPPPPQPIPTIPAPPPQI